MNKNKSFFFNSTIMLIKLLFNIFDTHIESGSDFEDEEVGWDLPLIQLENDHQPLSRY